MEAGQEPGPVSSCHGSLDSLRKRAEQRLAGAGPRGEELEDARRALDRFSAALHEQQVLQEELRMQNEELLRTQEELARASVHARDLFEHAPVGYLILDRQGKIQEANLSAVDLFGAGVEGLVQRKLSSFIERDSQDGFFLHYQAVFEIGGKHSTIVGVRDRLGVRREVRLESVAFSLDHGPKPDCCRTALVEITGEREARDWRERAEWLQRMAEELPAASVYIRNSRVELNRAAEALCGYSREELPTLDECFRKVWGEKGEEVRKIYQDLAARGFSEPTPLLTLRRKDGEERIVQGVAHRIGDDEIWLFSDLTERLRTEDSLRESEARLRQIAERVQDVVVLVERVGQKVLYCSPAYERIWGRPVEELYRNPLAWVEAIHPSDRERVMSAAVAMEGTGSAEEEYRIVRPDGTERIVRDRAFPVLDENGQCCRIAILVEDITGRREAENDQARLAALVTSSSKAILATDLDRVICHWNPAAERLFGYEAQEIIGRKVDVLVPKDREEEFLDLIRSIRGGAAKQVETIRLHKDGTRIDVALTVSQICDPRGRSMGISAMIQDIRERKRLEAQVAAAAQEEQQRIAMELHDSLGAMLTVIDLRATAFSRALEKRGQGSDAQETLAIAMEVRESIKQLRSLTSGLQPLDGDPASLVAALRDLAHRTSLSGRMKCRFVPPPRQVVLDVRNGATASHLLSIAREAVHNAVRHSGGTQVVIRLTQRRGGPLLTITDDGQGLRRDGDRGGSGLGIGTMEYRARLIGARLFLQQRDGKGTKVVCEMGSW